MASIGGVWDRDLKITGLVCGGHTLSHVYFMVLPPVLPVLKDAFGISYAALGLVLTIAGISTGLLQTPVGFLVDRIGGRRVLVVGLVVQAAAIAAIGLAESYWQLLALFTAASIANTVYHPADYAILSAAIPRAKLGRVYGIHSFTGNVGFAFAPIFMVTATALWSWRAAFLLIGALGLGYALLLIWQGRLLEADAEQRAARLRTRQAEAGANPSAGAGELKDGLALLFSLPVLMCFAYFIMLALGTGGLRTFLVAATEAMHGTSLATANAALSGMMAGAAAGILLGGVLADRVGLETRLAVGTLLPAAALILLVGHADLGAAGLIVVLTLIGACVGLLNPSRDLLIRAVTPDGSMGKVMGFASSGINLGAGLIPLLFGWIMDSGDPRLIFWLSALFVALATATFATARARVR